MCKNSPQFYSWKYPVPQENSEPELFTLNPLYLKSALDEAKISRRAEPVDWETPPSHSAHTQAEHQSALETSKAAIASKQAEIARLREDIDALSKLKGSPEPADPAAYQAELNELRIRRIAIQMALISDSDEYSDDDILALDRQIAAAVKQIAQARNPDAASNDVAAQAKAKIDRLQAEEISLNLELKALLANHYQRLAAQKAEAYAKALKAAHMLQHELLALASLAPGGGLLRNLDFGGELPQPSGLETFAATLPRSLAITLAGVEDAKARIRSELAL